MRPQSKQAVTNAYRNAFVAHGAGPAAGKWSAEGQRFRFEKLAAIGDLSGKSVLDPGCGVGDLYSFLAQRISDLSYTGVDIVPDLVEQARKAHPGARFRCQDVSVEKLVETFDYVLMSGVFNLRMADAGEFLRETLATAFTMCRIGVGFNFISRHVNFVDDEMQYYDPAEVLAYCLDRLTWKVVLHHHYERCDVAVYAYR